MSVIEWKFINFYDWPFSCKATNVFSILSGHFLSSHFYNFLKINLSLVNHRPGANTSSIELLEFTLARYVRLRLQSMHKTERRFYTVRHLKIGARVDCSGHASETTNSGDDVLWKFFFFLHFLKSLVERSGRCEFLFIISFYCAIFKSIWLEEYRKYLRHIDLDNTIAVCLLIPTINPFIIQFLLTNQIDECVCLHHTCGTNCEKCCPLYNQKAYMQGTLTEMNRCEKCEVRFEKFYRDILIGETFDLLSNEIWIAELNSSVMDMPRNVITIRK